MNHYVEIAEIMVDTDTHQIGLRFDGTDVYVLPPRAAESLGRGLIDVASFDAPRTVSPAKARLT